MKDYKKSNLYDCQCAFFSKKNPLISSKAKKISIKDKQALAGKLAKQDSLSKKNKIPLNTASDSVSKDVSKKQTIKPPENSNNNSPNPKINRPFIHYTPNFNQILKPLSKGPIQYQSPTAIKKAVISSQYFLGMNQKPKNNKIQFSYESNKSQEDSEQRNSSLKETKQMKGSTNIKTINSLKRSQSQVMKGDKCISEKIIKKDKCLSLKQNKKLDELSSKSILSSGQSKKSEANSQISEVVQNLFNKYNTNHMKFTFHKTNS